MDLPKHAYMFLYIFLPCIFLLVDYDTELPKEGMLNSLRIANIHCFSRLDGRSYNPC